MANNEKDGNLTNILLESGTNEVEFLEFLVGGEHFGVNVSKVSQSLVLKNLQVTQLPRMNSHVLGTVYFRNTPISVIDMRALLGITGTPANKDTQLLLVMEFNRRINGFVIDSVLGIRRVTWQNFVPLDTCIDQGDQKTVTGTIAIEERLVMILEMEQLMARIDPSSTFVNPKETPEEFTKNREHVSIVYAEDSPLIRNFTIQKLKEAGFSNIASFSTGAQALEHVMSTDANGIDIILSDIEMPEMDGLTFCKRCKTQESTKKIPFIFYSSMINQQMTAKCESVGGDRAFSKPDVPLIMPAIDELVEQYRRNRSEGAQAQTR